MKRTRKPPRGLNLDDLTAELNTYSNAVSTRLRAINLGVLGLAWLFLIQRQDLGTLARGIARRPLLVIILCSLVSLLLDLAQYRLAEGLTDAAFDRAEKSHPQSATYDQGSIAYRAQLWCYQGKFVLTLLAALGLAFLIARATR